MPALEGRNCIVTGGTAGIGFVTACELAGMGADVTIVGRDRDRGEAAAAAITARTRRGSAHYVQADLSRQADIRALAATYQDRNRKLDVLVNNAGGLFGARRLSSDGIEMTFALNHLGYFLLTQLLLPALRAAGPARIVVVASEAHRGETLDFDNLQGERGYNRWRAYKRSKLANILFTYELARRLAGDQVTVNALHPGFVATDIGVRHRFVPGLLWWVGKLAAISPEKGARTSIHLASHPDAVGISGKYFIACQPVRSSDVSYDAHAARRLWDESARLTDTAADR
jgi:NAD(P)-dependent dehydrogenase (short-subunit alcohol dehydrogenase family)